MDLLGESGRVSGTAHGAISIVEINRETVVTSQTLVTDPWDYVIDEPVGSMIASYTDPQS
jgi:phosphatidylglycerophosphatase A